MTPNEIRRENDIIRAKIAQMERMVAASQNRSGEDSHALLVAQARFDAAGAALGRSASEPTMVDTPESYRRKLLKELTEFSPRHKDVNVYTLTGSVLDSVEERVYHDAQEFARSTANNTPGKLLAVKERIGGRECTKFHGDPLVWMQAFMTGGQSGHFVRPEGQK
jgi:hypothetical protein